MDHCKQRTYACMVFIVPYEESRGGRARAERIQNE